jgi:hypothetical protein
VWGSGGVAPLFLTSTLDGGERSASRPGLFNPEETASGTHWIGSWVGPRAGMEAVEERKVSFPCPELNHGRPAPSPSLYGLSYPDPLVIDDMVILRWILEKCCWLMWVDFVHLVGIWPMVVSCGHGNEPSDSMQGGKFTE